MYTGFVQRGLPRSSPKNAAAPLYKLHKSALGCIGDSESPWTSHEESDVEKTFAVYGAKRHHVRTVRKAANCQGSMDNKHIRTYWRCCKVCAQLACGQSNPPWSAAFSEAKAAIPDGGRLVELPSHSFAVLNILECSFVKYIMSHPLLHSAISSLSPVIAGFNYGLRDTNLPRVRLPAPRVSRRLT